MLHRKKRRRPVVDARGRKESLYTIKIALRDGIVFVIVAARAPDGQAEKNIARGGGDLVQEILAQLRPEIGISFPGAHAQKAQRYQPLGPVLGFRALVFQFVPRQLFLDEKVVRFVGVECANHVIAIPPRGGPLGVDRESVALGKARQVQPVARPALAIAAIGQQFVDDFWVSILRAVAQEGIHFFGRRRQSDQVEGHAADQRATVRGRCRRQTFFFELC